MKLVNMSTRILASFLLVVYAFGAVGCSHEWKNKFLRKKKGNVNTPQPVLLLQSDAQAVHPPAIRYQEHFAYWRSWHSELLASLGQIRKRDIRYLNGVVSELRAMVEVVSGPPAVRLREIIGELSDLEETWARAPEPWRPPPMVRSRLEQLQREISKNLHYSQIKEVLVAE